MKSTIAALTLLFAAPAFSESAPPAPPAPAAPAAPAAPRPPAPPKQPALKISLNFRGTLHDALRELADKGHINLVITGKFDEPAEVYLKNVTAEEALQSVAAAYHLNMEQQGNVWTVHLGNAPAPAVAAVTASASSEAKTEAKAEAETDSDDEAEQETEDVDQAKEDAKEAVHDAAQQQKDVEQAQKDLDQANHEASQAAQTAAQAIVNMKVKKHHHHHGGHDYTVTGGGTVAEGTTVEGDAVTFGGNMVVKGNVQGDVFALGGNVDVHGHVDGDATAIGGNVHLYPESEVGGDVQAIGGTVIRDEGASVGGGTTHVPALTPHNVSDKVKGRERSAFLSFFMEFAVLFAVGFLAMIFAPDRMRRLQSELKADPWRCGLTGFVGSLALMALTFLLCITLIGAPFAFFLLLLVCVGLAMGMAAAASELGLRLPFFKNRKTQAIVLATGLVVLLLLKAIPVFGPLMMFLLCMVILGALIRTRFGSAPRLGIPERIESPAGV